MSGYVYVARNKAFADLVKVGFTTRTVQARMAELNSTGVPGQTSAVYYAVTSDAHRLEQLTHKALRTVRESKNREFFAITASEARRVIRMSAALSDIVISAEWSDKSVDLEDRSVRLAKAKQALEQYTMLYEEYMGAAYTSNPFRRAAQIEARAKMHALADKIQACEAEIATVSGRSTP